MMETLANQLALVTGGGRGLGEAIAQGLAEAGARVIVADIRADLAIATAERLSAAGHAAHAETLDVADRSSLADFAARIGQRHGNISILVNNAGIAGNERLGDDLSAAVWDANIAVNLTGAFDLSRVFLPALKATRGTIINVCSVVAFTSGFAHAGYVASKGGIRSLTQTLCRELAPFGIRVNAVAPGYISTAMTDPDDPVTRQWLDWHCPMKRFGEPHEVAGPVVFLASPAAGFVNGVTLPVDGGYLTI
jgi:NAD(P)-dependent dehydrogenase (short-subunit alcohol dehydrogenase family)